MSDETKMLRVLPLVHERVVERAKQHGMSLTRYASLALSYAMDKDDAGDLEMVEGFQEKRQTTDAA